MEYTKLQSKKSSSKTTLHPIISKNIKHQETLQENESFFQDMFPSIPLQEIKQSLLESENNIDMTLTRLISIAKVSESFGSIVLEEASSSLNSTKHAQFSLRPEDFSQEETHNEDEIQKNNQKLLELAKQISLAEFFSEDCLGFIGSEHDPVNKPLDERIAAIQQASSQKQLKNQIQTDAAIAKALEQSFAAELKTPGEPIQGSSSSSQNLETINKSPNVPLSENSVKTIDKKSPKSQRQIKFEKASFNWFIHSIPWFFYDRDPSMSTLSSCELLPTYKATCDFLKQEFVQYDSDILQLAFSLVSSSPKFSEKFNILIDQWFEVKKLIQTQVDAEMSNNIKPKTIWGNSQQQIPPKRSSLFKNSNSLHTNHKSKTRSNFIVPQVVKPMPHASHFSSLHIPNSSSLHSINTKGMKAFQPHPAPSAAQKTYTVINDRSHLSQPRDDDDSFAFSNFRKSHDAYLNEIHSIRVEMVQARKLRNYAQVAVLQKQLELKQSESHLSSKRLAEIVTTRDHVQLPTNVIDLHSLRRDDAIAVVHSVVSSFLEKRRNGTLERLSSYRKYRKFPFKFITGKGIHSKNSIPVLKNAVLELLLRMKIKCEIEPNNSGVIIAYF